MVEADEAIRPDSTVETLAKLPAVGGDDATHTAGNAPGVNDGAGRGGRRLGRVGEGQRPARALARVLAYGTVADDFAYLARTPANAAKQALEKIGKSADEIDLWEINEAFASVALNSVRMLGVDEDKVNVNGGAIALGHPIGASGARIVGALVHELRRRGGGLGCAAICSGGGQGDAIIVEVNGALRSAPKRARGGLLRSGPDPDLGVVRAAVGAGGGQGRADQPPPDGALGGRRAAVPAARRHRRGDRRGCSARSSEVFAGRAGAEAGAAGARRFWSGCCRGSTRRCSRRSTPTRTRGGARSSSRRPATSSSSCWRGSSTWTVGSGPATRSTRTGCFTGGLGGTFMYGEGKVEAMRAIRRRARDRPRELVRLLGLGLRPADAARGREPGGRQPGRGAGRGSPARRAGG